MLSLVQLLETPRTITRQAPLSMGFSRKEHCSGLLCPPPEDLPNPGLPHCRQILHHLSHQGSPGQFLLPGKIPLHFFRTPKGLMRGLGFQSSMPYWGAGGQGCGDGHHCPSQPMPAGVAQGAQAPLRPAQLCPAHRSFRLLHAPGGPTLAHTCF